MEGNRIRSAWEIALEKVERLGKLSAEEVQRSQENEYTPAGQALASRYLAGLPLRDVEIELDKYEGRPKVIVVRAALSALIEAIELEDRERAAKAMEGILYLLGDGPASEIANRVNALLQEYYQQKEQRYQESQAWISRKARQRLKAKGISGVAIVPNIRATEEWHGMLEEIERYYQDKLGTLKEELMALGLR